MKVPFHSYSVAVVGIAFWLGLPLIANAQRIVNPSAAGAPSRTYSGGANGRSFPYSVPGTGTQSYSVPGTGAPSRSVPGTGYEPSSVPGTGYPSGRRSVPGTGTAYYPSYPSYPTYPSSWRLGIFGQTLPQGRGVYITSVDPGSAAEQMGIEQEDVIVQINGRPIRSIHDIRSATSRSSGWARVLVLDNRTGNYLWHEGELQR